MGRYAGEVAERLNATVLKTVVGASPPWVRIPPSPPFGLSKALKFAENALLFGHVLRIERTHFRLGSYVGMP